MREKEKIEEEKRFSNNTTKRHQEQSKKKTHTNFINSYSKLKNKNIYYNFFLSKFLTHLSLTLLQYPHKSSPTITRERREEKILSFFASLSFFFVFG